MESSHGHPVATARKSRHARLVVMARLKSRHDLVDQEQNLRLRGETGRHSRRQLEELKHMLFLGSKVLQTQDTGLVKQPKVGRHTQHRLQGRSQL